MAIKFRWRKNRQRQYDYLLMSGVLSYNDVKKLMERDLIDARLRRLRIECMFYACMNIVLAYIVYIKFNVIFCGGQLTLVDHFTGFCFGVALELLGVYKAIKRTNKELWISRK